MGFDDPGVLQLVSGTLSLLPWSMRFLQERDYTFYGSCQVRVKRKANLPWEWWLGGWVFNRYHMYHMYIAYIHI